MKTKILLLTFILCSGFVCNAAPKMKVTAEPWIQNVTENSFTVLWNTPGKMLAWVEVFPDDDTEFYQQARQRYYQTVCGRRTFGTSHRIDVTGLQPGTSYRCRLVGRVVTDDSDPYGMKFGHYENYRTILTVKTLSADASGCRFSMVNDMHSNDAKYASLLAPVKAEETDFIALCGDIVSYVTSIDTLIRHTFHPVASLAAHLPFVYARGNHEGRGAEFYKTPEVFPTPTGCFYYFFRQGPVAFIVLDAGEDKPDSDIEYFGTADYDTYRAEELEWLKKTVKEEAFAKAPLKVVLMHVPAIADKKSWYSQTWIANNFNPVLNEAGVDLMLSGHLHRHVFYEKGVSTNEFPVIVNSNNERLDFTADSSSITIETFDEKGTLTHTYTIPAKN